MSKIKRIFIYLWLSMAVVYGLYRIIPFFYNYFVRKSIRNQIETIRQLPLIKRVNTSTLSRAEFITQHTEFAENYYVHTPVVSHVKLLVALHLLDQTIPLRQRLIQHELYSIFGLHVQYLSSKVSNVQIVSDRYVYQTPEKAVYAHEVVHALQHQHFSIETDWWSSIPLITNEALKGKRALLEGDARFTQNMFINSYLSESQQTELGTLFRNVLGRTQKQGFQSLPQIIKDELYFVYNEGEAFVRALYKNGGWTAVNSAYSTPPVSTEQILHPDRYLRGDKPVSVYLPVVKTVSNNDWFEVDHGEIGEFLLRKHLMQFLSEERAILASTGWGGDYYQLCERKTDATYALMIRIVWDHVSESEQFFSIYSEYGNTRYKYLIEDQSPAFMIWNAKHDSLLLMQRELETVVVYAPDLTTLASLKSDISDMYQD